MVEPSASVRTVGWDLGGAHVKACWLDAGQVRDIAQWPCALWQGLDRLDAALDAAWQRWPWMHEPAVQHAATMTGEMVDLFPDREQGVCRLAAHLALRLPARLQFYAGADGFKPRWVAPADVGRHWAAIASANWGASAQWLALRCDEAVWVDIGSTTTDFIPVRGGRVVAQGWTDAQRLATGELVYHGVVRTPLCALAARVPFGGEQVNVMNEFFATTADVYRLTGGLAAAHDQQPTADGAGKDWAATCQRLARMIGRDARDAPLQAWQALAGAWRDAQLDEWAGQLERVLARSALGPAAALVVAGCGDFVAAALAERVGRPWRRFERCGLPWHAQAPEATRPWAAVCAPAVATALLAMQGGEPCG
jgi:probable H4MPT-linked C1 transfer pathway protein